MSKGKAIYLTQEQMSLILEALDMLQLDYDYEHSQSDEIEKLENKVLKVWRPGLVTSRPLKFLETQ